LFRASSFGFRVSALWMAVVPRCTRDHVNSHPALDHRCERQRRGLIR
jgi:hypothetical protein